MQSLVVSWAVCATLALKRKSAGANVQVVETVNCDTSIIPVRARDRHTRGIMVFAWSASRDGIVPRAVAS